VAGGRAVVLRLRWWDEQPASGIRMSQMLNYEMKWESYTWSLTTKAVVGPDTSLL
jgi:hypothetical protein